MISKRPYREAIPVPKAIRILMDGKGTQWDPLVVDTMLSLVRPFSVQRTLRAVSGNDF
jgi:HD-GYP domain-containing protein (c-di-GMP phosphodiesterase class II)